MPDQRRAQNLPPAPITMPVIAWRRRILAAFSVALFALPGSVLGQVARELNNGFKDILQVWAAPARLDESDLPGIATLMGATGIAVLLDEPTLSWLRHHPNSLPVRILGPFREGKPLNIIGRSYFLGGSSAVLFLVGWLADDLDLRNAGRGCASSVAATTFSRHLIARMLGRMRPRDNRGAFAIRPFAWGDWEMRSFPGGHAANAMTCLTFLNRRFDLGAAEPVLYGLAIAVGAGRVVDEAHWSSDTVFGLGYGHAVGRDIALQQQQRDLAEPTSARPSLVVGFTISF